MKTRKNRLLLRCGAALSAALVMMPSAAAADGREAVRIPRLLRVLWEAKTAQRDDWALLLVNPWNTVPEDYEIELASLSNGLRWTRGSMTR